MKELTAKERQELEVALFNAKSVVTFLEKQLSLSSKPAKKVDLKFLAFKEACRRKAASRYI